MLSSRQGQVLRIISREFITAGVPVSSDVIAHNYDLGVSPATIRNDVAWLEREGYILRPHTSAGAVPSHKGYRHFVETMEVPPELPPWEQHMVSHLFHQVERDTEEWVGLAASLLGRLTRYASLVTLPRAEENLFRHIGLVSLHQFLAMIILVLREARLRQLLLPLEQPTSQEVLDAAAIRLNRACYGMDAVAIGNLAEEMTHPLDQAVSRAVVPMMRRADRQETAELQFYGWGYILDEPELLGNTARETVEALEGWGLPPSLLPTDGLRVIIGEESQEVALHPLSLVIASYGVAPRVKGFIGVVGPTRMRYGRAISAVKYVSEQLSYLLGEIYS
ncbi:MAG: heat-inducible transcriptional repressor HrcA [Dehalococcoidia bacterium]